MVLVGVVLNDLLGGITGCINFIQVVVFIPHPYLVSFLFIPSLYSLLFNSRNFSFSSLLPFFTACMHVQSPGVQ